MRQIEENMLYAIRNRKNWNQSNTSVVVNAFGIYVYLHGNLICEIAKDGTRKYSHCGWKTNTTKSRLNALGAGIRQRNYTWYDADGNVFINQI